MRPPIAVRSDFKARTLEAGKVIREAVGLLAALCRAEGAPPPAAPVVALAPGRVNLIGEHTDYNEGYVLPAAVNLYTAAAACRRADGQLVIRSSGFGDEVRVELEVSVGVQGDASAPLGRGSAAVSPGSWQSYAIGVADCLVRGGFHLAGANVAVASNLPLGAGMSSSASFELAVAVALLAVTEGDARRAAVSGLPLLSSSLARVDCGAGSETLRRLALLAQGAENRYAGVACGIMDQFACALAQRGHLMFLDCRTLETRHVPFLPGHRILVVDSGVRRALAQSEYNRRRAECASAIDALRRPGSGLSTTRALRDVDSAALRQLEDALRAGSGGEAGSVSGAASVAAGASSGGMGVVLRRARHVVTENQRVLRAVAELENRSAEGFGRLMFESHASLARDYEVSSAELDSIVEVLSETDGVVGAKMTGAGFGGAVVAVCRDDFGTRGVQGVLQRYMGMGQGRKEGTPGGGPRAYLLEAADGVGALFPSA